MKRLFAVLLIVAPLASAELTAEEAIRGGVEWLVENQNEDGSWGRFTSGRTWEVRAHVPGGLHAFRSASTSLCWMGLAEVEHQTDKSRAAQRRALAWLVKNARVKRAHPNELYNTWSFGYGLQAMARARKRKAPGATAEEIRGMADAIVKSLALYQTPDGGWGYYDFQTRSFKPSWSTSFSTATILIAMIEAKEAGIEIPPKMIAKAKRNVERCRKPNGTYLYGLYARYYPNSGISKPQGSSMRTQACNLALHVAGDEIGEKELRAGLEQMARHHRFALAGVRRPIPHESWFAVSGYFYLYGHFYAGLALDRLTAADRRRFAPVVIEGVLETGQPDGSFWDYPLYGFHKPYGTGYALLALACASRS